VWTPTKLTQVGCTGAICSAGSCMSTGELHERISAPHGVRRRDQDTKFTAAFDTVFTAGVVEVLITPARAAGKRLCGG
jgi:hypothetical protein